MLKARGILLSKSGGPIANPEETRLIVVQPLLNRNLDKITLELVKTKLIDSIGQ
jgi:hypothetical protein